MHAALCSYGGVRGCYVPVLEVNEETIVDKIAWPGVTKYTNFAFRDQGVEVTQGYKNGIPKFFSYDVLLKKKRPQRATNYVISADYSRPHVLVGAIDKTAKMSIVITCTESTVSMLKNRRGCTSIIC